MKKNFDWKVMLGTGTVILGIAVIILIGIYNINDLKEARKAEATLKNLRELRIALEKYYTLTKDYPDLTKDGAKDNLKILDFKTPTGETISFAEIYGRNSIPKTPENERVNSSNEVYNTNDFRNGTNIGGWNYDYSGHTGEIHANLPFNVFSQNMNWCEH